MNEILMFRNTPYIIINARDLHSQLPRIVCCGLKTITYKATQLWQQLPEKKKELLSELQSLSSENTLNCHFEFAKGTLED